MKRDQAARNVDPDRFFENLLTAEELRAQAETWLKRKFAKNRVYRWKKRGLPAQKICGCLYFPRDEAALWFQRTKDP